MDFELSADQLALRDAARDLLDSAASEERVRAAIGSAYDARLWREMAEQGWLALELPEDAGGLGLGFVESAVLAEEVGRHVAPAPWLSTSLALWAFTRADSTGGWVDKLSSGEAVGAVGWDGAPVLDAPSADVVVLATPGGVTAVDVAAGERPAAEPVMDVTRQVAWVRGAEGDTRLGGPDLAAGVLDRGAVALAAELLGASQRMLEVATDYAKTREQFGKPIGSFQAIKHRLADMLVDVEGMRSAVWYAAWALSTDAEDASLAASTAKAWASEAGPRVMAGALQVHGGIGFTWEHPLHLYLKRVQLSSVQFGDAAFHRERVARLLRERLAAGVGVF